MSITARSIRARALLFATAALAATSCTESLLVTPARAPAQLLVSWSLDGEGAAGGGAAAAFDRADRLRVQVIRSGAVLDTILAFQSAGQVTLVPLRVDVGETSEQASIEIELRRGAEALFRASASAVLTRGDTAHVELQLLPVAAGVVLPAQLPTLTALGDTTTIRGAVIFATGDTLPGVVPSFTSTNSGVASITSGGFVTAHTEGQTEIRATHLSFVATGTLQVAAAVTQVTLQPPTATVGRNQNVTLVATPRDRNGNALNRAVTWTTSAPTVASVTPTGPNTAQVQGLSAGQSTITAVAQGVQGSAVITVVVPVVSVSVTGPTAPLRPGETAQLTATPRDTAGNPLNRPVTWSSSDTTIATVTAAGLVTARRAGVATISATSEGRVGTLQITVVDAIASVVITPSPVNLAPGGSIDLTATPRNAANQPLTGRVITWQSSNPNIVAITQVTGSVARITALAEGQATITATSEGVNGTVPVTVQQQVANVTVSPQSRDLVIGDSAQFTGIALSQTGAPIPGRTFTWQSSDPNVASVVSTGPNTAIVVALAAGQATITATTQGVSGSAVVRITQPSGIFFADGFEGGLNWSATGYWQRSNGQASNILVGHYVQLPPNDPTGGRLPLPVEGSWYVWYGNPQYGSYIGQQVSGDPPFSGGTSTSAHEGALTSPTFTVPAGVTLVYLNFTTWFEIESFNPADFDVMEIDVLSATTHIARATFRLNPFVDGEFGEPHIALTNAGYDVPAEFQNRSLPVNIAAGESLYLVLRFATVDEQYNGFRGWIMDDISVTAQPLYPVGGPAASGAWQPTACEGSCPPARPRRSR